MGEQQQNQGAQPAVTAAGQHQATPASVAWPHSFSATTASGAGSSDSGYPDAFIHQLNEHIRHAQRQQDPGALLLLTIDNLAMAISAFGRSATEDMMRHIQRTIVSFIGAQDSITRLQRDQFAIILCAATPADLQYISERITSYIRHMGSQWAAHAMHLKGSIVWVAFPSEARTALEVLDLAYVRQFGSDGNERIQEPSDLKRSAQDRETMGLASYLNKAIIEDRLLMALQPVIDATSGAVVHHEALLRMRSDDGKISSAGALIPIAERMGLIETIDLLVLDKTVAMLRDYPQARIAFNVSNLTTTNPVWLEALAHHLTESPELATRMVVEITETAAQRNLGQTASFVAEIQSYGALVALDDFGSGYTSFRQLKSLSVDMVKIDGAFIKDMVDNADNRLFVSTLLTFTKSFGLKSVAEFVENGETAKMLMELGVDYLQGYYFGHPETDLPWKSS